MANAITVAKEYLDILDQEYKLGSRTSVLDVAPDAVKAAANAGEFNVKKLALVGLGDYSKTDGPPIGDISVTWETHAYHYDRGRKLNLDAVDDLEAMGVFYDAASEFLRLKVTPEIDAIRMAVLAAAAGFKVEAALADAAGWVAALDEAMNVMDDNEVPEDNRILFITGRGRRLVANQVKTAAVTDALDRCTVVTMPQTRFYTGFTLDPGATANAGGYANTTHKINFMLVDRSACFVDAKHSSIKYFTPQENQSADSYLFHYRIYHDAFAYEQRVNGIYVHYKDIAS